MEKRYSVVANGETADVTIATSDRDCALAIYLDFYQSGLCDSITLKNIATGELIASYVVATGEL